MTKEPRIIVIDPLYIAISVIYGITLRIGPNIHGLGAYYVLKRYQNRCYPGPETELYAICVFGTNIGTICCYPTL